MISNIELLKEELKKLKEGNVQTTSSKLAVEFGRNKRNIIESMKQMESAGLLTISSLGKWKYNEDQ